MKPSDAAPELPFPRPKISLLDLKPAPRHWPSEKRSQYMADQMGMTLAEFDAYLDSLPKR